MTLRTLGLATLLLVGFFGLGSATAADRSVGPELRAQVESALRREGFTGWDEIEWDDRLIEVDDAVDATGRKVDVKIDPDSLAIVKRDSD